MIRTSIMEKLNILLSIIKNCEEIKYIIPIMIFVVLLLFLSCFKKNKIIKVLYMIVYLGIIGTLGYFFYPKLLEFLDYLIEVIVNNILFPNLALYTVILLIINFSVIKSIFSNKIKYYIKNINIICYSLISFLLFFIIKNIITNNINVYDELMVYANQELLTLIEFSMLIFVIWVLIHIIIGIVNYISMRVVKVEKVVLKEDNNIHNELVLEVEDIKEEPVFIEYVPIKKKAYR